MSVRARSLFVNYSAATATVYRYCDLLTHLVRRQIGKLQKHSRVPHIHVVAVFHVAETRVFVVRHQLRCAGDKDVWRATSLKSASAGRAYEHLLQVSLNHIQHRFQRSGRVVVGGQNNLEPRGERSAVWCPGAEGADHTRLLHCKEVEEN